MIMVSDLDQITLSKIFRSGSDTIEIFRSGSDYQISISAQHWLQSSVPTQFGKHSVLPLCI